MRHRLNLVVLFFVVSAIVAAAPIRLFDRRNGEVRPVANYDTLLAAIRPGDELFFPDGSHFVVNGELNGRRENGRPEGANTRVLEVREIVGGNTGAPAAIRLSLDASRLPILNEFIEGYQMLRDFGVPTVEILRSQPGQYILVERLDVQCTLNDLVSGRLRREGRVDQRGERAMYRELIEFARSIFLFRDIGDFNLDQLVWVGDRWVLADWVREHSLMEGFHLGHPFQHMRRGEWAQLPGFVRNGINQVVRDLRLQLPGYCVAGYARMNGATPMPTAGSPVNVSPR